MIVSELIQKLQQIPPNALVLASVDSEGNDYRHVDNVEYPYLACDSSYGWDVRALSDFDTQEEVDVALDTMKEAVILW